MLDDVLLLKQLGSLLFISVTNFIAYILTFKCCTVGRDFYTFLLPMNKKVSILLSWKENTNPVHYKWLGLPIEEVDPPVLPH